MDAKITKQRLGQMLSYDWLKIILSIAAGILVWSLVFTTTATRITPSQSFGIFNYLGSSVSTKFNDYADRPELFSYEVLEVSAQDLNVSGDQYAFQIMEARLATDEADVMFVANIDGGYLEYSENGETKKATYLEDFLYRYYAYAYRLDDADGQKGYLTQMKEYLNGYYNGDYTNADGLDEQKVESDFRARAKNNKDKRYKTEEKIQQGVQDDIQRIQSYRQSLVDFYEYLDKGYIQLTQETLHFVDSNGQPHDITGSFSINLCPNEETMGELKSEVYYRVTDEETEQMKSTALNMNLVVINDVKTESGFEFERLGFVTQLVQKYCSELKTA